MSRLHIRRKRITYKELHSGEFSEIIKHISHAQVL